MGRRRRSNATVTLSNRTPHNFCDSKRPQVNKGRRRRASLGPFVLRPVSFQWSSRTLQSCNDAAFHPGTHDPPAAIRISSLAGVPSSAHWHDCSADCESATSGPRHGPPTSTCRPSRSPQAHPPATALPPSSSVLTDFTRHYGPTKGRPFLLSIVTLTSRPSSAPHQPSDRQSPHEPRRAPPPLHQPFGPRAPPISDSSPATKRRAAGIVHAPTPGTSGDGGGPGHGGAG